MIAVGDIDLRYEIAMHQKVTGHRSKSVIFNYRWSYLVESMGYQGRSEGMRSWTH
jgi:hypothetical protein